MKKLLVLVLTSFLVMPPTQAWAQVEKKEEMQSSTGPRKQLATIIFAGLGGAILGLSTLSFSGRPQDNLKNIAIGFAVGVIGGTAYASYTAAMRPNEFYGEDFGTGASTDFYRYHAPKSPVLGPVYMTWSF